MKIIRYKYDEEEQYHQILPLELEFSEKEVVSSFKEQLSVFNGC